jgi:hypothetical protein
MRRDAGAAQMSSPSPIGGHSRLDDPNHTRRAEIRASARARIESWLLGGDPQPLPERSGATGATVAGGVAGQVSRDGSIEYLYPEITGYFLQWLASCVTATNRSQLSARAAHAQAWLRHWVSMTPMPPTRMYLRGDSDDWRNRTIFCFDHAMVLRGLASAARRGLITLDGTLVASVCAQLETLIAADGILDACRVDGDLSMLPQRWSTRRGGFLAKASAGILQAAAVTSIPERLATSARMSFAASLRFAVTERRSPECSSSSTFSSRATLQRAG